nr:MAG TPA: hypothetical protein [Caudoviricetes sp.]
MATIKATLQNLRNNGWGYYPCPVGGKLHINRDDNLYMLVRNDTHEIVCQWNKNTGVAYVLGELAWHEKSAINQIIAVWRPWFQVDWETWEATHRKAYKTLLPLKQLA